jgi:hypothetical protein
MHVAAAWLAFRLSIRWGGGGGEVPSKSRPADRLQLLVIFEQNTRTVSRTFVSCSRPPTLATRQYSTLSELFYATEKVFK